MNKTPDTKCKVCGKGPYGVHWLYWKSGRDDTDKNLYHMMCLPKK